MSSKKAFSKGTICPPEHKHEATSVCYAHHRCRCQWCVSEARARYQERMGAHGKWMADELIIEFEHLTSLGVSGELAIQQIGVTKNTAQSVFYKNKRGDLARKLNPSSRYEETPSKL